MHTRTGACSGARAAGCAKGMGTVEPREGYRSRRRRGQRLRREGWRRVPPERSADEDGSGVGAVVMAQSLKRKATVQRQHKVTNKQYLALGNPRRWCSGCVYMQGPGRAEVQGPLDVSGRVRRVRCKTRARRGAPRKSVGTQPGCGPRARRSHRTAASRRVTWPRWGPRRG